jgi:proteasome lid subunit RPN8/RPN11
VNITQVLIEMMKEHAQVCFPEEGCGVLGGKGETADCFRPITNELHSANRFRMDAEEQLQAFLWFEQNDIELLGIFHSHPAGPNHPSPTDLEEFAYPGVAYFILSHKGSGWQVNCFQIEGIEYKEIPLNLI